MKFVSLSCVVILTGALAFTSCKEAKKDPGTGTNRADSTTTIVAADTPAYQPAEKLTITRAEVPEKARVAFEAKVPRASRVEYKKAKAPSAPDTTTYHYYFEYDRDGYQYWLVYDADGNPIQHNHYKKIEGLPDAVSQTIAEYFPDYRIIETDRENDKDLVMYEVEMERGGEKWKIKFLPDGGMYKIK